MTPLALMHVGSPQRGEIWADLLPRYVPGLQVRQWPDHGRLEEIGYVAAWTLPDELLPALPHLRFLMSVGAGVDQLDLSRVPTQLPILRMSDPTLVAGMVEFVVASVLDLHRELHLYRSAAASGQWKPRKRIKASERRVGIMGIGAIGRAVLSGLAPFGFKLSGWSRSKHEVDSVDCFAGNAELKDFLSNLDILVCLLPLTPDTRGILNTALFQMLPRGAAIVNVSRGAHLVEQDLLEALAQNQLSRAILDVFSSEPLPASSPLWANPAVEITPHIASSTDPYSGARFVADAIIADLNGQPLPNQIDRSSGY